MIYKKIVYFCKKKNLDKIGNILYTDEIVNHKKIEYINYINDYNFYKIENNLPTLIIGWNNVKNNKFNYENLNILNKEILKQNLYWTFSFDENKQQHIDDVNIFSLLLPDYYFRDRFKYINLDPVFSNINNIGMVIYHLLKKPIKTSYYDGNMIYSLCGDTIYGIDLNMYEFFNIDRDEILNIFEYKVKNLIYDLDNGIYEKYLKYFRGYEYTKRYLVTLL